MEYLILTGVLFSLLVLLFVREGYQAKQRRKRFVQSLYENFGKLPVKEYTLESSAHIAGYFQRHTEEGLLDEITWNDLNMDDIFKRMNYTHSATGEEYLYYLLHKTNHTLEELQHFEELVRWFAEHADERVTLQCVLHDLGFSGKYSMYDYMDNLDFLGNRSNVKNHILNLLYIPLAILVPIRMSVALAAICFLSVYRIVTYFAEKREIESYIVCFAYVTRLIQAGDKISKQKLDCARKELEDVQNYLADLKGISKGFGVVSSVGNPNTSGNPLEIVMDYVRMIFHVDMIVFNRMLHQLMSKMEQVDKLNTILGQLEAAVCVSSFRASLVNGYCVPDLTEGKGLLLEEGYHPLLTDPVKNSIAAQRGVLLTGSNASGKSTFLKTVAVNAILAQTIHTCTAKVYKAPVWTIYSSMALRDNMESGESYYIVEIKALKRILDAQKRGEQVLCFVDEVLRGTNTVERIAASTEILKSLAMGDVICFAATHDIELTHLLKQDYDNYHFEEEIKEGDISFPYKLLRGKATTRNAIRLLEMIGYSPEVTKQAMERAEDFVKTGTWQT